MASEEHKDIPEVKETYIGDGVYIKHENGYSIWLRTDRTGMRQDDSDFICLEPSMLQELVNYARNLGWSVI